MDKKTVEAYIAELKKLNQEDKIEATSDPVQASKTLLRLSKNGVKAIRRRNYRHSIVSTLLVAGPQRW